MPTVRPPLQGSRISYWDTHGVAMGYLGPRRWRFGGRLRWGSIFIKVGAFKCLEAGAFGSLGDRQCLAPFAIGQLREHNRGPKGPTARTNLAMGNAHGTQFTTT